MKCVYCEQEKKGSAEHIISKSVLDLFPECFLTFGIPEDKVHDADPVVKDVCRDCNSKVSYIDSYARDFIKDNFMISRNWKETQAITYDYVLVQKVLLKNAYNDVRAHKKDNSFFDSEIRKYILNQDDNHPKENVIVLAGFGENTTPVPDMIFGNQKLVLVNDPILWQDTIVEFTDYQNWTYKMRDNPERYYIPGAKLVYSFRFGHGRFLLVCFEKGFEEINRQKIVLKCRYPYVLLDETGKADLPCCTSYFNYHNPEFIFLRWDPAFELSYMAEGANEENEHLQKLKKLFEEQEKQLAMEHKRR